MISYNSCEFVRGPINHVPFFSLYHDTKNGFRSRVPDQHSTCATQLPLGILDRVGQPGISSMGGFAMTGILINTCGYNETDIRQL